MSATPASLRRKEAQAACLAALRAGKDRPSAIAIHAKITLSAAASSLSTLARRGLATRDKDGSWRVTESGRLCRFDPVARPTDQPGPRLPTDQRLLEILDRPMSATQIVAKLKISRQLLQLVLIRLHAQGELTFGDPDRPSWLVMRAGERMSMLSREEERVLSATPADYASDAAKIGAVSRVAHADVPRMIEGLIAQGLVEASPGPRGDRVYRLTAEGVDHPQRRQGSRDAPQPRLPVESDRIRGMLSTIEGAGTIGIKQLSLELGWQHHATNALIQYLKRKQLVGKTGPEMMAPYTLTETGGIALSEMKLRWPDRFAGKTPSNPGTEAASAVDRTLVLTKSEAACLTMVRDGRANKTAIAIHARLDFGQTESALRVLVRQGLVRHESGSGWLATAIGKVCRFETVADQPSQVESPLASDERLLEMLDRPRKGAHLAEQMQVTNRTMYERLIRLYARGRIDFADLEDPMWLVRRPGDQTLVLSPDEERVLSAVPLDCASDATSISIAAGVAGKQVAQLLQRLIRAGFVNARNGTRGDRLYSLTEEGASHPQHRRIRSARPPRLPFESDRVRNVLATIHESGALRIKQVSQALHIPRQSMNALIQYLKRRKMVEKAEPVMNAPYALTDLGRQALSEMTRRRAA